MRLIEFLYSDIAKLPRRREAGDFLSFLQRLLKDYTDELSRIEETDHVSRAVKASVSVSVGLKDAILEAVDYQTRGFPHRAFGSLALGLDAIAPHIEALSTPRIFDVEGALDELYRIRVERKPGEGAGFQRQDLFGFPFQLSHLVTRQRYSLSGLPCLYLGGTLYVCWEELGRPNLDAVYYSRFKPAPDQTLSFLDFAYRPAMIAALMQARLDELKEDSPFAKFAVAQALCWPLIASCSVRKLHEDAPFIHEYIIPHLLLQWVRDGDSHDGIRYFSVKIESYLGSAPMFANYVFPAKKFSSTGHCRALLSKFQMSQPLSWSLLERGGMPDGMSATSCVHGGVRIALVPGTEVIYQNTPFGKIEAMSLAFPCESAIETTNQLH